MELRQLRYFLAVAQELNITRAAERLNMSQPPLSNQIRALEEELGVTLFVRGKRRLTLTEEGSFLLQRAAQLLDLEDKTRQELTTMKDGISGTLCLGMVEGRTPYLCGGSPGSGRSSPGCATACGTAAATMCWTGCAGGWPTWR